MGNPSLKLNQNAIIVDGFYFNVSMTIFLERFSIHSDWPENSVIPKLATYIKKRGYEHIADTVLRFDEFVSNQQDRTDLIQWIKQLKNAVIEPSFELPAVWKKLIESVPSVNDFTMHEARLNIAYVYQMMIDLIDGKIQEKLVRRITRPADWGGH